MINLLKYDLRRNANTLLGVTVILLLLELGLLWSTAMIEVKIGLTVVFIMVASIIFLLTSLKVFDYNIKSISRRLLPVHPFSYVGSSLIFGFITTLIVALIGGGAGLYLISRLDFDSSQWFDLSPLAITGVVLEFIVMIVYGLMTFYVVIALARSFVRKGAFRLGLVIFIILIAVTDWLETILFGRDSSQLFGIVTIHIESNRTTGTYITSTGDVNWLSIGNMLFALALCVIYLFVIKWCVDKKVEAR